MSIFFVSVNNSEYGYRFVHQELLEDGYSIGKDSLIKNMG